MNGGVRRYHGTIFQRVSHRLVVASTSNRSRNKRQSKFQGDIRIIGGQWRRRRLPVADVPGLRPTGDRVRETLFNWLQTSIAGTHCLDLFAGTGALGLEALSRHAASVVFVEPNTLACTSLKDSLARLSGAVAEMQPAVDDRPSRVLNMTAETFLSKNRLPFDLVFLDPPFDDAVQWSMLQSLMPVHLASNALIYIESPGTQPEPTDWPAGCTIQREKQFGDVVVRLIAYSAL